MASEPLLKNEVHQDKDRNQAAVRGTARDRHRATAIPSRPKKPPTKSMMIIAGGIVRPFDRIGERHQVKAAVLCKAEQSRLRALHGCQTDQAGDEQDPGCVRETRRTLPR